MYLLFIANLASCDSTKVPGLLNILLVLLFTSKANLDERSFNKQN